VPDHQQLQQQQQNQQLQQHHRPMIDPSRLFVRRNFSVMSGVSSGTTWFLYILAVYAVEFLLSLKHAIQVGFFCRSFYG